MGYGFGCPDFLFSIRYSVFSISVRSTGPSTCLNVLMDQIFPKEKSLVHQYPAVALLRRVAVSHGSK